jgi:hypothetical protein
LLIARGRSPAATPVVLQDAGASRLGVFDDAGAAMCAHAMGRSSVEGRKIAISWRPWAIDPEFRGSTTQGLVLLVILCDWPTDIPGKTRNLLGDRKTLPADP